VEWADLQIIDLSQAGTPDGRARLAKQVRDAMITTGFFYVVNHGYTREQVNRNMYSQANHLTQPLAELQNDRYRGRYIRSSQLGGKAGLQ
jgi:isopenicillin N synthase-like dioxygenase